MKNRTKEEKQFLKLLGQRIRHTRKIKGIRQLDIGAFSNSEKANISRIEAGKTSSKILTLLDITQALQIPLLELFSADLPNTVCS